MPLFLIGCGVVLLIISNIMNTSIERTEAFKQACSEAKGTPVHNGKNWECLPQPEVVK